MAHPIGVKLFGHDSSIFSIYHGNIFAVATERYTRTKHDTKYVREALADFCASHPEINDCYLIDSFSIDRLKDARTFTRFRYYAMQESGFVTTKGLKRHQKLIAMLRSGQLRDIGSSLRGTLAIHLPQKRPTIDDYRHAVVADARHHRLPITNLTFQDHHLCHAASAYWFSGYRQCLTVTMDGRGDGYFSKVYQCDHGRFKVLHTSDERHSLGDLYSWCTLALGLKPVCDEGKTEALACYGSKNNAFYRLLRKSIHIHDGSIMFKDSMPKSIRDNINASYNTDNILCKYLQDWIVRIGEKDFAAAIQGILEDVGCEFFSSLSKRYKTKRFALAGGLFANVKLNLLLHERLGLEFYVFPAMGDDGGAAGAALLGMHEHETDLSWVSNQVMPYWGPSYSKEDVLAELRCWEKHITYRDLGNTWPKQLASLIADGKICALFQGRMEFGPRALGNRSILADPRDPNVRDKINLQFKRRVWYQPFCPSILESERQRLFVDSYPNRHMTCAFTVKKTHWKRIPAVMHVDHTARPQFVQKEDNPGYYRLLTELKRLTGYGVVLNTSFNLHGRAIVRTPADALRDFLDCSLDALCIEGYLVQRRS